MNASRLVPHFDHLVHEVTVLLHLSASNDVCEREYVLNVLMDFLLILVLKE